MRQLAVLGWFFHHNLGDQLFIEAYKALFPNWKIHPFTNDQPIDFDLINKCDAFALGGGELINQGQLFIPSYWTNKIDQDIPKFIFGCGVNAEKLSQLRLNVLQELLNFSYIGLRDTYSVKLLSEYSLIQKRVGLFFDMVFSVPFNKVPVYERKERVAVVIPTDRFTNKFDRGIKQFNVAKRSGKWLKEKVSYYDRVVFLAFGSEENNDYKTCQTLAETIDKPSTVISDSDKNSNQMIQEIANCTTVFSYRLHGLVLAKIFNKPCGIYPYHWKLERMENTLLGCDPEVISVWQRETVNKLLRSNNLES